jgi:hypothetical protein
MTRRLEETNARYGGNWFQWDNSPFPAAYPPQREWLEPRQLAGECDGAADGYGFDPDEMELGFSFKKFAKGAAKGLGKVGKAALKVAKVAAPIAAFVVPGGIAVTAAVAGADKLISSAEKGSKAARKAYKATKKLAARGDPAAKNALDVLKKVQAERAAKGIPAGKPLPAANTPAARAALQQHKAALQTPVKAGVQGYLVTRQGRITAGNFQKA